MQKRVQNYVEALTTKGLTGMEIRVAEAWCVRESFDFDCFNVSQFFIFSNSLLVFECFQFQIGIFFRCFSYCFLRLPLAFHFQSLQHPMIFYMYIFLRNSVW